MSTNKTDNNEEMQRLQNLKFRLESDMRRISMIGGIPGPNDPIVRNYKNVVSEIQKIGK